MFDALMATACGRLTSAPDKRSSKDGDKQFMTFSIAVNTDKDSVTYISVSAFGFVAEKIVTQLAKGDRVTVMGPMEMAQSKEGKNYLRMTAERLFPGTVHSQNTRQDSSKPVENGQGLPPYQVEENSDEYI